MNSKKSGKHVSYNDNKDVITHRLKVFRDKTAPLIDFYRQKGILNAVDADGDMDEIEGRIQKLLI